MSSATSIEWTDRTWNPVRSCSRVSEGCRNCYAERQAARFSDPGRYAHGFVERTKSGPRWTGRVELVPEKLAEPLSWRKPQRVFVNSMSDLFHGDLPDEDIVRVFAVMHQAPRHTFQVLTKRPERMREWFTRSVHWNAYTRMLKLTGPLTDARIAGNPWPLPNVWLGVSVEDQKTADERIPILLDTPAAVRFVSAEPLIGPVKLHEYLLGFAAGNGVADCSCGHGHGFYRCPNYGSVSAKCHIRECGCPGFTKARGASGLHWLIVGGESGPGARPCDVAWIRSIVKQCKSAGVACFVKQLGSNPWADQSRCDEPANHWIHRLRDRKGGDLDEWPSDLRVREFPGSES